MKRIKIFSLSLLITCCLGLAFSCTEGFEEMNENPNQSARALPENLLAPAITDIVKRNLDRAMRLTNELMQVHVTTVNSDEIHRYVIRTAEADYMWTNWYMQLTNIRDMYVGAEETGSTAFMGISLILDAWVNSLITDTYGDVPYTEAIQGKTGQYMPKFDKQEVIYADLFRKLDSANALLKRSSNLTAVQSEKDPLYKGNVALWRKFGNSLYLRLLLRVSGKSEPIAGGKTAAEKIREIVQEKPAEYPIMASNMESAVLMFTGAVPYQSTFHTWRAFDFNGSSSLSQFFVNNLLQWEDPRLPLWATVWESFYSGIPSGYPVTNVPEAQSRYLPALATEPRLGNILNYAELQFILAEAALRGFISGDPKTYYENGVTSAITFWEVPVPDNYLEKAEVKWNENQDFETKLEQIHLQKYYTLFFTDFQQWFEFRRTGHPVLPKGPGLQNGGVMPARLNYPLFVQTLNQENYRAAVADQGPDNINTKVWWQE
ncbi:SusD/RagB family nutrient-binding outer membrane lipoprotein [Rufibacter roseus]|uniref:SusD/RagB family nutrient-binding outer membrane lipoprotein n=1 Tax=Rufibacter roseus TaxID=1567108 RepID=A0ABW2DL54_9BACT|nr:SusD/RagB family nutrient-binding outer membrane lipoprotein [Rufibacter roseus]